MSERTEIPESSPKAREPQANVVFRGAVIAGLLLVAVTTLWWPMGRDQGVFAWVGSTIVRGGASYADAWEIKGPAAHLTYALSQLLFGSGMWGIRLLDLLVLAATAVLCWRLLTRFEAGAVGALLGACLVMVWHWRPGYWDTAQPDAWAALLMLAAIALSASVSDIERSSTGGAFARAATAGAMLGIGAMFKPLFAGFAILLLVLGWPERGEERQPRQWSTISLSLIGMAVVVGAVIAWMATTGALGPFLRIQFDFNWAVHRTGSAPGPLEHLRQAHPFLADPGRLLAVPLAVAGALWAWRTHRRLALALLAILAIAAGAVVIQGKYYPYHFAPVMASLALLAGLGVRAIDELDLGRPSLGTSVAAAVIVVNLVALAPSSWSWMNHIAGGTTEKEYYAQFGWEGDFSFEQCEYIAGLVEDGTDPEDTILVWALDPLIYYLSQRMPPTRFGAHYPLTRGSENPFESEWRQEFMRDLSARPPELIVLADHDENNLLPKASIDYINDFPEFKQFLVDGYESEAGTGRFYIMRKKAGFAP